MKVSVIRAHYALMCGIYSVPSRFFGNKDTAGPGGKTFKKGRRTKPITAVCLDKIGLCCECSGQSEPNPAVLSTGKAVRSCSGGTWTQGKEDVLVALSSFKRQADLGSSRYDVRMPSPLASLVVEGTLNTLQRRLMKSRGKRHVYSVSHVAFLLSTV